MRYIRLALILIVSLALVSGCNAKSKPNTLTSVVNGGNLQLSLEISKQDFATGKDYFAKVSLKNLGNKPLTFNKGDLFKVVVLDEKGKVVWPNGSIPGLSGYDPITIKKGASYSNERIFIIDKPGTYKIICSLASGAVKKVEGEHVVRDNPPKLETKPIEIKVGGSNPKGTVI